jgi:putative sugar O-methyltransferase
MLEPVIMARGYDLIDSRLVYDWQRRPGGPRPTYSESTSSVDTQALQVHNPELLDLKTRYTHCSPEVTTPLVWNDDVLTAQDLLRFRGDNAYIWQLRGRNMNPLAYALTAYYVRSIDSLGLLARCPEDEAFGNIVFEVGGRTVSRDLLDSMVELYFLERHLGLSGRAGLRMMDIGAGYGRLAHRTLQAFPGVSEYVCGDAFATSTFLSKFYLNFRGMGDRASVVPLDQVEQRLAEGGIDLAVNVHSFSECRLEAIEWWLSRLARARVRHLMLVPNTPDNVGEQLLTNDGRDFQPIVERNGYELVAKDPKFMDPIVQQYAINPTHHFLFELRSAPR